MLDFFQKVIELLGFILETVVQAYKTLGVFLEMITTSPISLGVLVARLPVVIQLCAVTVIAVSVVKAIFGRIGSN